MLLILRSRGLVCLLSAALVGCGPSVSVDNADSDGNSGSSTSSTSTGSPDPSLDPPPPTTDPTPDPESTTAVSTTGTSTSTTGPATTTDDPTAGSDDSTTDGPYTCGCPASLPVGYEEVVGGRAPIDELAPLTSSSMNLNWFGLLNPRPATAAELTLSYSGGPILLGPGGSDGCQFLSSPCPTGFDIPVTAHLVSEDGLLDGTFETIVTIPDPDDGGATYVWANNLPLDTFGDPFAAEPYVDSEGEAAVLESLGYTVVWDGEIVFESHLRGNSDRNGGTVLLASTFEP